MLPLARSATPLDKDAETLAAAAAQVGLDRIAAGQMYRDTAAYEGVLLRDAARRGWRVELVGREQARRRQAGPSSVGVWRDWPAWLTALYYLFLLTRRPWTYLSLYTARRPRQSWHGELAEIYLGARQRQSSLTRAKAPLRALIADLNDAWTEVQANIIDTAVARWLDRMERELGSDAELQDAHRYTRHAGPVLASLHAEEHAGQAYPALQEACLALVRMTRPAGAAPGGHDEAPLLAALGELVPGLEGAAFPDDGALRRWLDGLPARPAGDLPPKAVLGAIGVVPRLEPPVTPTVPATQDDPLFGEMMESCAPGSFEQTVLVRLSEDCDRGRVLGALYPDFPTPDALDEDAVQAVATRLEIWSQYVEQTEQGRLPAHHERYLWVEIPPALRNAAALAEARARLGKISGPWPPAAAAARFSLTLEQLALEMAVIRRRDRGGPAAAL